MSALSREQQNTLLTRTGPGTPMGDVFRRYWLPALLAEEIPEPDCAPVRVQILSDKLLAFRDSEGRLGLIDEFCAHRGVSLWFGRNEESGIRCPYHGWKFDVKGQCTEVPSEPASSQFCNRIKLTSYPLVERGGVLWTYMGPPDHQPELPEFEFATVGAKHRYISKRFQCCNWLQSMEGGIDPNHVAFLHGGELAKEAMIANPALTQYLRHDLQVKINTEDSPGGMICAYGREEGDSSYWRVLQWIMPNFTLIPPFGDHPVHGHFWVPINDEESWTYTFDYAPDRELTDKEFQDARDGKGPHVKVVSGTYMPVANKGNDYLMDREKQKAGIHYSGIESLGMQDASVQESMGPIQDRTKEHLCSSDRIIVAARRHLIAAAEALKDGTTPPGTDPSSHRVRSATALLGNGAVVLETPRVREALCAHAGTPFLSE